MLPHPIVISLAGEEGFRLRQLAADYLAENQNITGAQRGSTAEQSYGALAEIVIRNKLGMPEINPKEHPLGYDILLPTQIKLDVKCRGGEKAFLEEYIGSDSLPREAKHNIFARQMYDKNLDAEIFLMTHLERPKGAVLPGTLRQRKWNLYICGWISKKRIIREGVYLPPGSISERGREWFAYRAHEIEIYNRNLNGLAQLKDILNITKEDVEKDEIRKGDLNLTRVDTLRIGYDMAGRGIIDANQLNFIVNELKLASGVGSFLHANQLAHVLKWLKENGLLTEQQYEDKTKQITIEEFKGF